MRASRITKLSMLPVFAIALFLQSCASPPDIPTATPSVAATSPAVAASQPAVSFIPAVPVEFESGLKSTRDQYNQSYSHPDFQREPNDFLLKCLDQIAAKLKLEQRDPRVIPDPDPSALEIALGNGRNAIPIAEHGYRTVAFDLSDVGVNMARKQAAESGLSDRLDVQVADAFSFDYGHDRWNIVVMMYFYIGHGHLQKVKDSVKPRGYIILEYIDTNVTNEVLSKFMDWEIVHYEHAYLPRDWAPYNTKSPGPVLRLMARKPVAAPAMLERAK